MYPITLSLVKPWLLNTSLDSAAQSIVSLTSSLVVQMLTVLVSTISNSQVILLKKKCEKRLQMQTPLTFFFGKYISVHAISNDQSFKYVN